MHNKNEQFVPDTSIFQSPAFPSASCHVSFSITNSTFSFVSILKKNIDSEPSIRSDKLTDRASWAEDQSCNFERCCWHGWHGDDGIGM